MKAEALFNRGETADAAIFAHKALYQAENKRQTSVSIGTLLLLGRLAVSNGGGGEFADILERIPRHARQNPLKSNRMEADMARAYLMQLIDRPQDMAEWIREGDIGEKRLFVMTIPYAQILFGKHLIQSGKPESWLGMEGKFLAPADGLCCRMAVIYGKILTAAAQLALNMTAEAATALKAAFDLALSDRLYMPFAENRLLVGSLLDETCPADVLKEITALSEKHEAGKAAIMRKLYPSLYFDLTEREYEIARLVARNIDVREIAKELRVSHNTAKTHIRNVCKKTGVSSMSGLEKLFEKDSRPDRSPV
jgi:LuxR family maltose regulon positive regulatory protein